MDAGDILMLAEIFADACATMDDFEKACLDERSEALFEEWTDVGVDWIRFEENDFIFDDELVERAPQARRRR